jgi:predicted nucleotide-binding protein (sugar kinase/HSP70/actin superfamily)
MLELIDAGVKNIVCTQPFGCLPNHIMGKGMMKPLKERNENVNIVAIDYDPGATRINQENRIKLMLSNARRDMETGASELAEQEALAEKILV